MTALDQLKPTGDDGEIRMIVETPRGSNIKLKYEPSLGLFTVSRALPLGLNYPFDWGFVPGTRSEDGDPLDALALHDAAFPAQCFLAAPSAWSTSSKTASTASAKRTRGSS